MVIQLVRQGSRDYISNVAAKKQIVPPSFLPSVQDYLSRQAKICETDENGHPTGPIRSAVLSEHTFYHFDAESAAAMCYAIEDLALEEATGRLLAGFQDFEEIASHRERYALLGATITKVEVVGSGKFPARLRHLKYVKDRKNLCFGYRLALYEGPRCQALFVGRQENATQVPEEKQFLGFYTFNPVLIRRLEQQFRELAAGRSPSLHEFSRQAALHHAARQMQNEFARQREQLFEAMRRLQLDGEQYCAGEFAMDLEKGLAQLSQWKERMPQILAHIEGR